MSGGGSFAVWRECVVHEFIVKRAALFPLAHLMVHGVVLAGHGDALANGLHTMTPHDWAQEVWSLAAMGLQLQELYISAKFMNPDAWDELASALRWARANAEVLQDAHWAIAADGCQGTKGKAFRPYAVAAWGAVAARGFLMLRNPRGRKQKSPRFTLAAALELPAELASGLLVVEVVRRMAEGPLGSGGAAALECSAISQRAHQAGPGRCVVAAGETLRIRLAPGELLVLAAETWSGGSSERDRHSEL